MRGTADEDRSWGGEGEGGQSGRWGRGYEEECLIGGVEDGGDVSTGPGVTVQAVCHVLIFSVNVPVTLAAVKRELEGKTGPVKETANFIYEQVYLSELKACL